MQFDLAKRLPAYPEISNERLSLYFSYLALKGAKRYSAMMAGIEPSQLRNLMKTNEELANREQDALTEYKEQIDMEIHRRAVDGVQKPVFFKGNICGYATVKSDRLLEFLARANNPEKYSDHLTVDANVKAGVLVVNATLDPDDWEKQYGDMRVDKTRVESACSQSSEEK